MLALDSGLLLEDTRAPVSLTDLASLSPARLAVASLRLDVHPLVRQRAHVDFLERRTRYRSSSRRDSQEEPLFDLPLTFLVPGSPTLLSIAHLVLVQFNPHCQSPQAAQAAAELFLQRAAETQDEREGSQAPSRSQTLSIECCRLVRQGMGKEAVGGLALEVTDEALVVTRGGQFLLQVLAEDITAFKYLLASPGARAVADFHCTLEVAALHVGLDKDNTVSDSTLELVIGEFGSGDARFEQLETTVEKWTTSQGFAIQVIQTQPAAENQIPTKRPRSPLLTPPASRSPSEAAQRQDDSAALVPSAAKRRRSDGGPSESKSSRTAQSTAMQSAREGPWRYVGETAAELEWHPGAFVRQLALLQAIAPNANLFLPPVTADDLALLSRQVVRRQLPKLPHRVPDCAPHVNHNAVWRLALENAYRLGPRIDLMTSRLVLLTDEYVDLREYAKIGSKMVDARNAIGAAYHQVLDKVLPIRLAQQNETTRAQVEKLISLVHNMRTDPLFRRTHLLDERGGLIRTVWPTFSEADLGPSVFARFERALADIVEYEASAGAVV
ncbi:hypothetical protein JCM3775_004808 [Rhodotorula graminis]